MSQAEVKECRDEKYSPFSLSQHAVGVSTSTLGFALPAEVSEPGPLLQRKRVLHIPSGGAGRKTAVGGVKCSTPTAGSELGESM